jgi:hypothetical protein
MSDEQRDVRYAFGLCGIHWLWGRLHPQKTMGGGRLGLKYAAHHAYNKIAFGS